MRSYKKLRSNLDSGFTLIELLVVIIIIGILAGIAVIGVSGAQNAAVSKACTANSVQVAKGLRAYKASKDVFPTPYTPGTAYTDTVLAALWNTSTDKFLENPVPELSASPTNKYTLFAVVDSNGGITVSSARGNGSYADSISADPTKFMCAKVTG